MRKVKAKQVVNYMAMPGIVPRVREFFGSGFGYLAYLMAYIFASVRLLPSGHPYLNPSNMGKFGVHHVVAQAATNLQFSRKNIDQIIIFFALILGIVTLVMQIAILIFSLVFRPAMAGIFTTPAPATDVAFQLLDLVFGVPLFFGSAYDPLNAAGVPPYVAGFQAMLQFFSLAMLIVAVIIFLYYILVAVGETASTGTPFGRRFAHIWAPIRLVVALGLLVPINYGLNSAQYIVLAAAKYGSGFATNAWITFNTALVYGPLDMADTSGGGPVNKFLSRPKTPDISSVVGFMAVAVTCEIIYETMNFGGGLWSFDIEPYLIYPTSPPPVVSYNTVAADGTPYATALGYFNNRDIIITFGHHYPAGYPGYKGGVLPLCGSIRIHTNDVTQIGSMQMQGVWYDEVINLWTAADITEYAERVTHVMMLNDLGVGADVLWNDSVGGWADAVENPITLSYVAEARYDQMPPQEYVGAVIQARETAIIASQNAAYNAMAADIRTNQAAMQAQIIDRGWGGAGIWYNQIAEWNGAFMSAIMNFPTADTMPMIMAEVESQRNAQNEQTNQVERYRPSASNGEKIRYQVKGDEQGARVLAAVYEQWTASEAIHETDRQGNGNMLEIVIKAVLGDDGLFTLRDNKDIHPLAQLVGLGRGIVDGSLRYLSYGLMGTGGSAAMEQFQLFSVPGKFVSDMFISFATFGLVVGFILYYVLPFMPFIYFYFSVGRWVKTIFEAIVAVPLWALAHLRIDGNGLPSDTALNGYFLIFEIFVRPILTVFGLLAGLVIFSAMARTLNDIFPLLTANLHGFDENYCVTSGPCGGGATMANFLNPQNMGEYKRSGVDEVFFTVFYTILLYLLGTSSFKMIDQVPNSILRWMGAGVQSFSDNAPDPTQGMVQYMAFGGSQMAEQATGAMQGVAKAGGDGVNAVFKGLAGKYGITNVAGKP